MAQFKVDKLEEELHRLRRASPMILGSLILSIEGLPIASDLPEDLSDDERVAARSAAMLVLGERIALELDRGELDQVFLSGTDGFVIVVAINYEAALTVLCEKETRVPMALLDIYYTVEELRQLL